MISLIKLLAHRYATAYFQTIGAGLTKIEYERARAFGHFIKKHERSLVLLTIPVITNHEKQAALDRLSDLYELPATFHALTALLIEHKRIFLLPEVIEELCSLFEKKQGIERFVIVCSHELEEQSRALIKDFLKVATGKDILDEVVVDKQLIAGIRLQSDEHIWEYSVRNQLRALHTLLAHKGSYGD